MAMFAPELKFQKKEGTSKSPEAWSVTKSYCEIKYIYDTRIFTLNPYCRKERLKSNCAVNSKTVATLAQWLQKNSPQKRQELR